MFLTFNVHPQSIKLLDKIKATLELDGDLDRLDFLFDVMMPEARKYQVNLFYTFYVMYMPKFTFTCSHFIRRSYPERLTVGTGTFPLREVG